MPAISGILREDVESQYRDTEEQYTRLEKQGPYEVTYNRGKALLRFLSDPEMAVRKITIETLKEECQKLKEIIGNWDA